MVDHEQDEPTLPPLDPRAGAVCPRCHEPLRPIATLPPRSLPRCPKHGLAFVEARELVDSNHDRLLGTTVAGRFTVISRLGSGSMGAVYRARQDAVGRDVALKIVKAERAYDPETKTRFEREARATSSLVSPNTITVFDFGASEDGSWFLAMELLEGESLGERLRRVGRLPVGAAVRIAHEAATSLAEAHGKGIVHRDLKPDNLFLAKVPRTAGAAGEIVKVLDFGIAKLVRGEEEHVDQLETQAGTVFGTPRYMSPEQAQGAPLDARTDIYSLGVILYHMLSGRAPFTDEDAVVVMARHIKEEPPHFSAIAADVVVPPPLERVVRRALAKNPSDRQQSAAELAAELDSALLASSVLATGTHSTWATAPPSAARAGSSRTLLAAGVVGLLGLLFVAGVVVVRSVGGAPAASAGPLQAAAESVPQPAASAAPAPSEPSSSAAPSGSVVQAAADAGPPKKRPGRVVKPPAAPRLAPTKPETPYGRFE